MAVAVKLGFGGDPFGYAIDLGLPIPSSTLFGRDPGIKREVVWAGTALRPAATLLDRRNGAVRGRVDGDWHVLRADLEPTDSVFDAPEAVATPEVIALRDQIRTWRFYEQLRTDADAPARRVWPGTRTWALAADGADLASAWQTIAESGDDDVQTACVDDAFPGARVEVVATQGRFALEVSQPGLLRPLGAEELSDGTLRYLAWIAALLSPRPPALLVLNEPETSLHPSVIPALARLIARAARRTQVIVVSHAGALVEALAGDALCHEFHKRDGATEVVGQGLVARPSWRWPER